MSRPTVNDPVSRLPAPESEARPADEPLRLPPGVPWGTRRQRALQLISELPPAQRDLVMERMQRLPPAEAGPLLSDIGRMESSSVLRELLQVGRQRVSGETPRAGGEFGSPEQMQQHRDEVAPQIVEQPEGRTRAPQDPTEGPAETQEPLEGLSTFERRPPAPISPERAGADRSALREGMTPPKWATGKRSWEAHHIIPVELQYHEVLEVLRNKGGGWDHNAPSNGIALPTRLDIARATGLPVHQITAEVIAARQAEVIAARRAERAAQGLPEVPMPEVPMPDAQTLRDLRGHPVTNEAVKLELDRLAEQRLPDGSRLIDNPPLLRQAVEALQQKLVLGMRGGRQVAQP